MIRVLIADDHAILRRGLKEILERELEGAVCGEAKDAGGILGRIHESDWDLVILDISMPGRSGLDVLRELKAARPKLPILVLSMYPEDQYAIRALLFTRDDKSLVSASCDAVCLWDRATGKLLREFSGHGEYIKAIALSPDGKLLAAAEFSGMIHIWEVATGKQLHPGEGHQDGVNVLAYSPDGKTLVSGGSDGLFFWDIAGLGLPGSFRKIPWHRLSFACGMAAMGLSLTFGSPQTDRL